MGLRDFMGKSFDLKLSGNEVYCINALLLLIKIMLCTNKDHAVGFEYSI